MMWKTAVALLPAVLAAVFFFRTYALSLIAISCLSSALGEIAGRVIFKKKPTLYDGSAVLTGLIFSLLLPPTIPVWMAAAGSFIAIFLGREVWGGLGSNPLNPALVGLAFLHVGFSQPMSQSPAMTETLPALSLFAGGLFLILQKLIRWEIPALYLLILFFFSVLIGGNSAQQSSQMAAPAIFSGTLLLFAFFVITDPVTTPLTRTGCRLFAVASAILAVLLSRWLPSATTASLPFSEASVFSVLLMNAAVPWIDRRIRPSGAYQKKR